MGANARSGKTDRCKYNIRIIIYRNKRHIKGQHCICFCKVPIMKDYLLSISLKLASNFSLLQSVSQILDVYSIQLQLYIQIVSEEIKVVGQMSRDLIINNFMCKSQLDLHDFFIDRKPIKL